jgi:hypothetical protein
MARPLFWLAVAQAAYYVLTGVWPLVSIRTFIRVTGPKRDLWLVRTVGVLVLVIGCVIGVAAWRGEVSPEVILLAVGSAVGLTAIDVIYVARGTIDKIYLLDAAAEVALVALWACAYSARH